MIQIMEQRIDEIRIIEAQAYFNQRKWGRYGILLYMRFLLKNDFAHEFYAEEGYAAMSSNEKLATSTSVLEMRLFSVTRI